MPTKKQTKKASSQSRLSKIHKIVTENFETSAIMASVLLNIFFLTGLVLYHTSSSFEGKVFRYANNRYCEERNSDVSKVDYELSCRTGDFAPHYKQALEQYLAK